jgi:anti-sigma regulatory factor (Ser/Thr protein kinase)/anti-anti-sigma regulatory factor
MAIDFKVGGDDSVVVAMAGRLGLPDVAAVRLRLLKCLADSPAALLVDLSALTVTDNLALSLFAATSRTAAQWPGIPLVLCAPTAEVRAELSNAAYRGIPVFGTVAVAREYVHHHRETMPTRTDEILPVAGAPRQARNLATEACTLWSLPELIEPARLIVSELASNVVDHARTMATVRLSLRREYLTIAVRDGSPAEPVRPTRADPVDLATRGRGLLIVEASARSWGWLPSEGGKVVWAALTR